jgi:hypothetical protein
LEREEEEGKCAQLIGNVVKAGSVRMGIFYIVLHPFL